MHQPPNIRLESGGRKGLTDSWSIRSDGDMGRVLEIFLKGKKKHVPLSSMHVGC